MPESSGICQERLHAIHEALLSWFKLHGRTFPWRETRNPFHLLVAEKLLQQTAARPYVVQVFELLIERYPAATSLAAADPSELRALIAPLGLAYRAGELVQLSEALANQYGGEVPGNLDELLTLPGIGDYTARALLCFAYGQDYPVVDTNVARFLFRLMGLPGKMPANPARHRALLDLARAMIPAKRARDYNFAVLDLCAQVCTVRMPDCEHCPLQHLCAYARGLTAK